MLVERKACGHVANAFWSRLELIWPKSSLKTSKMSKKMRFWQKAPGLSQWVKEARNSFLFPQTSFTSSLVSVWNLPQTYLKRISTLFFSGKPVTIATPRIESYRVIKRTGRWNLLKLLYYMLLGMIIKICKFKKNSVGQMKVKTYFSTIAFLIFFPPTEFFKNWYIYASDWS